LGSDLQISRDAALTGDQCKWQSGQSCSWDVVLKVLKIVNLDPTPIFSGSYVDLFGVKTPAVGSSQNVTVCKISGTSGDITTSNSVPYFREYFPYPQIDTSQVSLRRFVISDLITEFFYKLGNGILSFTASYTDVFDSTTIIKFDLGADFGQNIVCNVRLQN